jgi:hypothetical protein
VQNDPELAKTADDVCDSMWKVNLRHDPRFRDVENFSDLTPQQQVNARLFHQALAADSIMQGKLDEFKAAADLSFGERRQISRLLRLQDEAQELSTASDKERDLRDEYVAAYDDSRQAAGWERDARDDGYHNVADLHRDSSRNSAAYGDRTREKAARMTEKRRDKRDRVEAKIAEIDAPWWLKEKRFP